MLIVEHRCPDCGAVSLAPIVAIAAGDAGIWQCEQCDNAYEIEINFRVVSPDLLQQQRDEFFAGAPAAAEDDEEQYEKRQRRLLDIQREIEGLYQIIEDLNDEAERLQDESDSED